MKSYNSRRKAATVLGLVKNSFCDMLQRCFLPFSLVSLSKVHCFKFKFYQSLSRCRQIHKGAHIHACAHTHILNCGHFREVAISNQIQTFWHLVMFIFIYAWQNATSFFEGGRNTKNP